jgi:hypothetical protein
MRQKGKIRKLGHEPYPPWSRQVTSGSTGTQMGMCRYMEACAKAAANASIFIPKIAVTK